jgi:hypothetical protein
MSPTVLVDCFLDGLRDDIHAVFLISYSKPQDHDSACSLTLLQEDMLLLQPRQAAKHLDMVMPPRPPVQQQALPLPLLLPSAKSTGMPTTGNHRTRQAPPAS